MPFGPALSADGSTETNREVPVLVPPADAGGSDRDISQLRTENEQLKASIRNATAHRHITGELERIGARSPELLFDAVKGELQFSADGAISSFDRCGSGHPQRSKSEQGITR